jgi:transaldolase / glucose-6-phosphate isomerase
LGVDLSSIGHKLQEDALAAAQRVHQNLIHSVIQKRNQMEDEWRRMSVHLHDYQAAVDEAAGAMCEQRLLHQIWDHDPALWQEPSFHFRGGSSWLHLPALMPENSGRIHRLLETARETGYTDAVLFGTGESRLAGELFSRRSSLLARSGFAGPPFLNLWLLDPVIPAAAFARSMQLNPHKTLYVVASKSGEEMEMLYALDLFYNRASTVLGEGEAKNHFVAVTDPGSRLVEIAQRYGFRDVFVNDPAVSGRYATLSYFGLLPAALAGVDVDLLLEGALMAACNAECCNCAVKGDNVAALLGTILGVLARNGRDKLLLVTSPALATFGEWVGRLMADNLRQAPASPIPWSGMRRPSDARPPRPPATIQPIAAAAVPEPAWFGSDHLTVYLRLEGDGSHDQSVSALQEAGQPVVTLRWQDVCELGGQIFTWQMATAVAGYHLGATVLEL